MIQKSSDLFKLMFEESRVSDRTMQLYWSTMRKADQDTKNALNSLLNEVFYAFKDHHSAFFLSKLGEMEAKSVSMDEIELLSKISSLQKYRLGDKDDEGALQDSAVKLLWRICTDPDVSNSEIVEKTISKMIALMKFGKKTAVERDIILEGIENLKEGKAVLQSLKVIRKIMSMRDDSTELLQLALDNNVLDYVFSNLRQFKRQLKDKLEKAGLDL